jgi:hypothetical protein
MKALVGAFSLAAMVATSASAKTESAAAVRPGMLSFFKADRTVARPPAQNYALMLGVAF